VQDVKIAVTLKSGRTFVKKFWRAYDLVMHLTLSGALLTPVIQVTGTDVEILAIFSCV
jgi:hypothetical protein